MILVLLWAFNPLGSQSSFRGVYLKDIEGFGTGPITHYNYNLSSQLGMTMFMSGHGRTTPKVRALYSTALYDVTASIQYVDKTNKTYQDIATILGGESSAGVQSAVDSWGNIRIPNLQAQADYVAEDPHRWVDTPWLDSVQSYSSLVGDRIEGINRNFTGNTTFNITSSYQHFDVRRRSIASLTQDLMYKLTQTSALHGRSSKISTKQING
jgi:hypothetical protein